MSAKKKGFTGNVCALPSPGQLTAAHISDPCTKLKTVKTHRKTSPLGGSVRQVIYEARWGVVSTVATPRHWLSISVDRVVGSGPTLKLVLKTLRGEVLAHGAPVAVSKGIASVAMETFSCANPPTHDCTQGSFMALVGHYVVQVGINDFPGGDPNAPEPPGEDEPEDVAQEEAVKPALVAIGQSVVSKL